MHNSGLGYMGSTGPEDIEDLSDAGEFLGVDWQVSDAEIKSAFEDIADDADDETYWAAVKAQEIALSNSTSGGKTIYTVCRDDIQPEDLSSLADAQSLLDAAPPSQDTRSSELYNRGLSTMANDVEQRLKELSDNPRCDINQSNIQAVSVAHYALRYHDLEKGKRYILGPDNGINQDSLITGWKYSVEPEKDREYYVSGDDMIQVYQKQNSEETSTKYVVVFSNKDDQTESEFHRYGEAKRMVKQWILDPPDL